MKRFQALAHSLAHNSYLQLCVGGLMAFSGIWEFLFEEIKEGEFFITPTHAITLLGSMKFLLALEKILSGGGLLVEATPGDIKEYDRREHGFFHRLFREPKFEIFVGVFLFVMSLNEVLEDFHAGLDGDEGVWYYGLILLGISSLVKGLKGLLRGPLKDFIGNHAGEAKKSWSLQFVSWLDTLLRNPVLEMTAAVLLVGLSLSEEFFFKPGNDELAIQGHLGMILNGALVMAKVATPIYDGLEIVQGSGESETSHIHNS